MTLLNPPSPGWTLSMINSELLLQIIIKEGGYHAQTNGQLLTSPSYMIKVFSPLERTLGPLKGSAREQPRDEKVGICGLECAGGRERNLRSLFIGGRSALRFELPQLVRASGQCVRDIGCDREARFTSRPG